jgi:hypothetical protein
MIIAIVALVAAIGGTAVAGGGFLQAKKFKKFKSTAVTRLTYVNNTVSVPNTASNYQHIAASCPPGYHAVGGGVKLTPSDPSLWWGDGYLTTSGYAADVFNSISPTATGQAVITVSCVAANATGSPASP